MRSPLTLVGVAFSLLLAAWVMANAPFNAPDEASHYLRALNIADGHLLGPKIRYPPPPGITPTELAFADHDTRAVLVPARLTPSDVNCVNGRPDTSDQCVEATPTGDYYPLAYLLPAVALKLSHTTSTALWLSRLASALPCIGFLLLAIVLLWDGAAGSLLGLLAALTPMVLFVSSIINPSGLETASSIAFAAAVLRISRTPTQVPRWIWAAFCVSAVVAILSWQAGPGFVALDLLLLAALLGRRGAATLWRHNRGAIGVAALALAAALVLFVIYSSWSGVSHSTFGIHPFFASLHAGLDQLRYALHDAVGVFASLTVRLPPSLYWLWWLFVLGLVAAALWVGTARDRAVITAVTIGALALPVLAYAWVYRFSGFGLQGRQVLPVLVLIPLVAGELLHRRMLRGLTNARGRIALGGAVAFAGLFQLVAWWINARDSAGAPHSLLFFDHAVWSPPLGWGPWVALAALGAAALLCCASLIGRAAPSAIFVGR